MTHVDNGFGAALDEIIQEFVEYRNDHFVNQLTEDVKSVSLALKGVSQEDPEELTDRALKTITSFSTIISGLKGISTSEDLEYFLINASMSVRRPHMSKLIELLFEKGVLLIKH